MEADFWRGKWRDAQLGWHQPKAHPMLVRHLSALGLGQGARIFAPLCGKTLDIHWLLANGFRVAGSELVEGAVTQLFDEMGVGPEISSVGPLKRYSAKDVYIFAGDLFELDRETLGAVDGSYDRAALVAMPDGMRAAYAAHLAEITARAPQLLISFEYDQSMLEGPPFSVTGEEIERLYRGLYDVAPLASAELAGGLKGRCPAIETARRLFTR